MCRLLGCVIAAKMVMIGTVTLGSGLMLARCARRRRRR
jgi:hypothetical protein